MTVQDFEGTLYVESSDSDPRTNNTAARFTSYFSAPLDFSTDEFDVGLHELQLPFTWPNVRNDCLVLVNDKNEAPFTLQIPDGGYYDVQLLVDTINRVIREEAGASFKPEGLPSVTFKLGRVVTLAGEFKGKKGLSIAFSRNLAFILGFRNRYFVTDPPAADAFDAVFTPEGVLVYILGLSETASDPPDVHTAMPRIYVSCSLVKHAVNSQMDLLRVVPVDEARNFGTIILRTYDRPLFVPIRHYTFDKVDVAITDSKGEPVNFQSGTVVAALEFRKRSNGW